MRTWWEALPAVEQASAANIDKLVSLSEEIIGGESQAWLATSQVAKLLARDTADKASEDDKAEGKVVVQQSK